MIDPKTLQKAPWCGYARSAALTFFLSLFLAVATSGQKSAESVRPSDPLPQDTGAAGLRLLLKRLSTTARLLHTTAHPDDEDGGMMTLESRGRGDTIELLTLNRGEGGQNKVGSNLFDVLGVLRTLELTASDRYYGVEQRFTRVADFGFSKNPDETFQKWNGHDVVLADMVRVIRTFRPDVLVSRFQGTDRDGHGNHQASGIVSREAFRAAADPKRFPEQIAEGLQPWQAKKFYFDNVCPFRSNECPPENYTVKLSTGEKDADLGMTYIQFAMEGLRHQLSQGAGGWSVDAGPHYAFYRLVDSVLPPTAGKDGHEQDFFDGIDTSLPGLAGRLGADEGNVPWLRGELVKLQATVEQATKAAADDPAKAATPLLEGLQIAGTLVSRIAGEKQLAGAERQELLGNLRLKQEQFQGAVNLALGLSMSVTVDAETGATPEEAFMAVPGQAFGVTARVRNTGSKTATIQGVALDLPAGWRVTSTSSGVQSVSPGQEATAEFRVTAPENAAYTRPYWHRNNPETDGVNTVDEPHYATLAFPPAPLLAHMNYSVDALKSSLGDIVSASYRDSTGREQRRALAVTPPFSVAIEPISQVIPVGHQGSSSVKVDVRSGLPGPITASVRLEAPQGWQVEPGSQAVTFAKVGESKECEFTVVPSASREERTQLKASLMYHNKAYAEAYTVVTRDDLDTFYYYQPALQRVSVVDVKVPRDLKVGYIMGAGDDIHTVLRQVGLDVTMIPAEKLGTEDMGKYQTIVLGIRAYDTQKEVAANNKKLLEFVAAGGTLVVQYEADVGNFNGGSFAPYPVTLGRGRVSVEEAPVEVLAPQERVFHFPNEITQRDFEGWVQERGLYFMEKWDGKYTALLASHDPGEESLKGGLLVAKYGKGMYIYTGYAFFRQLPAGVPGAVRLYVNLLAAGR
ncbi:MAG TPA: NEW3 domain-containing protein [Terriglobales bacterium]|nr:NEW3 domain-containing protein [Terriglobales bacterium]